MLTQALCIHFLIDVCKSTQEVDDVLSAYLFGKYANGNTNPGVSRKLYILDRYLQTHGHFDILINHASAFSTLAEQIQLKGGSIGSTPVETNVGIEAWNIARRGISLRDDSLGLTDSQLCGPGSVKMVLEERRRISRIMPSAAHLTSYTPEQLRRLLPPPDYFQVYESPPPVQ